MIRFALAQKWWGGTLLTQNASGAKSMITNDLLARCGILEKPITPNRHRNDALRHLVLLSRRISNGEVIL